MKKYLFVSMLGVTLAACSMAPKKVERQVEECLEYDGFKPVVIIGRNMGVRNVVCTVDEDTGITIIPRGLDKLLIPRLPGRN